MKNQEVKKKILIKYTTTNLKENKKLFECPVYISVNGAIKFVDSIHFHKDKIQEIFKEHNTNGPLVLDYDEVMK